MKLEVGDKVYLTNCRDNQRDYGMTYIREIGIINCIKSDEYYTIEYSCNRRITVHSSRIFLYEKNEKKWDEIFETKEELIECVTCNHCGKKYNVDSENYYTVYGNICIGRRGGVVGNNFDSNNKLIRSQIYCKQCFKEVLYV